jgi:hypothetical protein
MKTYKYSDFLFRTMVSVEETTVDLYIDPPKINLDIKQGPVVTVGNSSVPIPKECYRIEDGRLTVESNEGYAKVKMDTVNNLGTLVEEDLSISLYTQGNTGYLPAFLGRKPFDYHYYYNMEYMIFRCT